MKKPVEYYLNLPYRPVILPDDEGFGIAVPDLPGCFSHAERWEEIPGMIREAMEVWIESALEDGDPIPEPATIAAAF